MMNIFICTLLAPRYEVGARSSAPSGSSGVSAIANMRSLTSSHARQKRGLAMK